MDEQKQTAAPIPISAIKPKTRLEGTVIKIDLFGALLDIGAERPGLLHISQIRAADQAAVNRVSDVLSVGSSLSVWVKSVDAGKGLINLTMIEPPRYDWDDLKRDMPISGTVTSVTDFGAFVDFGGPREGLIPAGRLSRERIGKPAAVVSEGSQVTAWIISVDRKRERIGLSMIAPPALPWAQVKKGHTYKGKVTRLERFGAFVDIGAERDGLIHVSELASGYVQDPSEVVTVGEEVEVKVLEVDRRKRQIQLSMKEALAQEMAKAEEEEEELPTSLAQAFQAAQQTPAQPEAAGAQPAAPKDKQRTQQLDILRRTLEQHQGQ